MVNPNMETSKVIFPDMPKVPRVYAPELPNLIDPKFQRISGSSTDASMFSSISEHIGKFNLEWFNGIKWPWQ
jgi:hypothetical protein